MSTLTLTELEQVYDLLADALDQVPPASTELFLVKLALLCAQTLGDAGTFTQLTQCALQDL